MRLATGRAESPESSPEGATGPPSENEPADDVRAGSRAVAGAAVITVRRGRDMWAEQRSRPNTAPRCRATPAPLILIVLILAGPSGVRGEIDVSIKIPLAVAENSTVNMTCDYDLHSMALYAVKWYKGPNEFYRYLPKEMPSKSSFGALGEKVDMNKSDHHSVIVSNVGSDLAGKYRCEVSTDVPFFFTRTESAYMNVVKLPEGNVTARMEKPRYAVGDTARGNCSVPLSSPPANITWTVNRLPMNSSYVRNVTSRLRNESRSWTLAGIEFDVTSDSFQAGRIVVSCRADLFRLYQQQASVALDEERPRLASVLGTRESSHSRGAERSRAGPWMLSALSLILTLGAAASS